MKNLTIAILFLSCKTAAGQNQEPTILDGLKNYGPVTVQLVNHTGYRIDTLIFGGIFFKYLENDSLTAPLKMDNYLENSFIYGSIHEIDLDKVQWIWHCTGAPYNYQYKTLLVEIVLIESPFIVGKCRLISKILEEKVTVKDD